MSNKESGAKTGMEKRLEWEADIIEGIALMQDIEWNEAVEIVNKESFMLAQEWARGTKGAAVAAIINGKMLREAMQ